MKIEQDKKFLSMLVNKQFEMKGIDYDYKRLSEDGLVDVGKKKKDWWYNQYKFDNEEEYVEWRAWMEEEVKKRYLYDTEKEITYVDLRYGMTFKY